MTLGACAVTAFLVYRAYRVPVAVEDAVSTPTLTESGTPRGNIPAIYEPSFVTVGTADQYLKDSGLGIDVEIAGERRFYPYQILVWHQVANDVLGETPIAVTFSPLTYTGIVFDRTVNGRELTFETAPYLWDNHLVMMDRETASLWVQMLGRAVEGELKDASVTVFPSRVVSWREWKAEYPRGRVLSLETGVERDYTLDPYTEYYDTQAIWFPLSHKDDRLPLKTPVYGVVRDGSVIAYPAELVDEGKVTIEEDTYPLLAYWFAWSSVHPDTELYLP